jgi:hypothetical protein
MEATRFESVAKEAAKAFPAQEIERSWFENLFVVNHVAPLSGFLKQADKETAAIQKKIDEQYEVIAKIEPVTDHVIADLQEQADRLRNEDGTLTSGSDSVLAAIVAHLEGTKVTSTEAAQEVLSGLIDEKVEALNDTVTKMVAEGTGADNPALLNHAKIANLKVYGDIKSIEAARAMDWRMIYTIPAVGALVIMVLFGIFFHEEKEEPAPTGETAEPAAEETAEGH